MKKIAEYSNASHFVFIHKGKELIVKIDNNELSISDTSKVTLSGLRLDSTDSKGRVLLVGENDGVLLTLWGEVLSYDGMTGEKMIVALIKSGLVLGADLELFEKVLDTHHKLMLAIQDYTEDMEYYKMLQSTQCGQSVYQFPLVSVQLLNFPRIMHLS